MTDTNKNQDTNTNMEGLNITDEQLEKLIQSETDKVRTKYSKEIKDMQDKITEYEEKQKEYEQKEKYYKTIDVLKENNIPSSLAKFINVDIENEEEINELKKVFKEQKLNDRHIPNNHRTEDTYSKAKDKGDIDGMMSSKLANWFK